MFCFLLFLSSSGRQGVFSLEIYLYVNDVWLLLEALRYVREKSGKVSTTNCCRFDDVNHACRPVISWFEKLLMNCRTIMMTTQTCAADSHPRISIFNIECVVQEVFGAEKPSGSRSSRERGEFAGRIWVDDVMMSRRISLSSSHSPPDSLYYEYDDPHDDDHRTDVKNYKTTRHHEDHH